MFHNRAIRGFTRKLLVVGFLTGGMCAFAQSSSSIVGVVRDPTGSVVPGVTVEASSPALIEGKRTAVTDSNGQYRIIDLRPGDYTVTFTQAGFRTMKREGITLPASFTATVNGDLAMGQTAESITVSDAPPLVDVQNSVAQQVMDRTRLDTIPTGRDPFAVGQLIAGVTTSNPDVGGAGGMQQPTLQVHGSSGNDNVIVVDGIQIQHVAFSGNQTGFYYNDGLMQEISYLTNTLPAEAPVGGIQISMVPREGGNQLHGSVFGSGANSSMQSNNLTRALRDLGLKAQNRIDTLYDLNATLGGPIMKDRIWFFSSFRRWGANNFLANTFYPNGAQALDDNRLTDLTLRLTTQVTKNNKFSVSYDRGFKFRGHRPNNYIGVNFSEPIATVVQKSWLNYMLQAKWTSTVTNRLLVEVGYTRLPVSYDLGLQPDVTPGAIAVWDTGTSTMMNVTPRADFDTGLMTTWTGSASYVTGAHNLKAGVQSRQGFFRESFISPGNMIQILNNGTPTSIRILNTPLAHREDLRPDLGLFVQDSWKVSRRVTLNLGLRFDHMVMLLPAQSAPGGTFVGPRSFPEQDIIHWSTWSPRFGFAWDVFGDSKTAIKGGISKYDRLEGTSLAQNVNPNFIAFSTCPWTKLTLPSSPGELTGCTGFSGNNNHIDPNMKRPYQWEYTVMIQRQIGRNTSVSAGYYGRKFYNLYGVVNLAVTPADYTAVQINNPLTNQPLTVYNQNPDTRGKINLLQKTLGDLYQRYNGVEFQFNTRFSRASVFGGLTIGGNHGTPDGTSTDLNNPNNRTNFDGNIGFDSTYQIRAGGSYQFPRGVMIAGSLREASGLPQSRTYNVTQAIVPGLTQVTQSVLVAHPGDFRYPWQNLLDLRVTKVFRVRERFKIEPTADLFNVFNSSAVTNAVTTIGPSLLRPSNIVMGRMLRLGGTFSF